MSISFRQKALSKLTDEIGVYALCDLDEVPIYVGQSIDGIRSRVRRHLTSARSDIIANRQVDVWEIAWVWAWPTSTEAIPSLEAHLFHEFDKNKTLMNGTIPVKPTKDIKPPKKEVVQVMDTNEIISRKDPVLRLPRQIEHYGRLVDHVLVVKDSGQLRRSLRAHF
ncbi:MAG: GIY-YIG nuclease family protein, partial [Afipia sp.]|nr:GIY-YIG nuclease family protein [Afipia sp.]